MAAHSKPSRGGYQGKPQPNRSPSTALLISALAALGATSIATQIVVLREFLSIFFGNELVIGVVLANWMILTGLGSFMGKFSERYAGDDSAIVTALIGLALLPTATVATLRLLRNIIFLPGSMIGITQSISYSLALLTPFCLVAGFSFVLFAATLSLRQGENPVAMSYSWESLGSAAGGAVFTLLILPWLDTFQALFILLALDLTLSLLVARGNGHHLQSTLCWGLLIAATLTMMLSAPDSITRKFLFPGQEIIAFKDTPYGNLTVTRQGDQFNFFENTVLMASTNEVASAEEGVHYAMAQHPGPHYVLLIGGGISGTAQEILKYDIRSVDYTEVNPWIIELGKTYTEALSNQRVRVILDDGRRHIRQTSNRYDVALINLPDPETAQLNRYFTVEFFQELKRVLRNGAIISLSLLPATEYQGPEARLLSSSLYATLKKIFTNVLIVPGGRNYFLASDAPLDINIGQLIANKGIETVYVNQYYLDDPMLKERSKKLTADLDPRAALNTDFAPVSYFQQLAYWLSSLGTSNGPWLFLPVAALLILGWKTSAINIGIFTSGFCASSLEIIVLLAFQTLYGSLYRMTGIIITAFMAGLSAGAWLVRHFGKQAGIDSFISLQLLVAACAIMITAVLPRLQMANPAPIAMHMTFPAMTFAIAALIGMEFAVASQVQAGTAATVAGELYGLDLAGSSVGALIVTVYAIPLLGIKSVSILVGGISLASAGICLLGRGRYQLRTGQ